ncbi:hypothetical protein U0C82_15415 [Fulvimarina sp. 2208YS6-2-32]|uniref:Uncharacterized protein n=1 Tax=Fulvimarina uroteuthidis TaxID=3098149 RepID=A0ABU5I5Y2_9HYPH|nr:hypothetical protein [Fulvimarina sp. 2208YS6-2-32]MDY8110530.1 hypothetical protein [Fulvimarina sp. 2208YS6-2-32]
MTLRIILGIVLGGILGCIATGAAVALIAGGDFAAFVTDPGKHGVSIAIAVVLPAFFLSMSMGWAILVGIVWCDVVAAVLTKFVFGGADAPWSMLLGFNLVYAVVAVLVFAALAADPLQARRAFRRG